MPGNKDIVTVPILCLVHRDDQTPGVMTEDLLVFVRGNVDVEKETFTGEDDETDKQNYST